MRLPTLFPLMRTALIVTPMILLTAGPASAQLQSREAIALRNDIYQLQQQIQQLREQMGNQGSSGSSYLGGGSAPTPSSGGSDLVAQLLSRVEDLSEQVRQLRGQVQETDNKLQQQTADLSKRIDDLAFQVQHPGATADQSGTGATNAASSAAGSNTSPQPAPLGVNRAPPPSKPAASSPPRTPEAAMKEGSAALARHDYKTAEADAREVLTKFRTSPRAYDAQFLLAEALAGRRQYPQAAIAYDDSYNRSRKGRHAEQSLLGLASSLIAIKETKAACDTLSKLHAEFPHMKSDVREFAATLRKRAGCR